MKVPVLAVAAVLLLAACEEVGTTKIDEPLAEETPREIRLASEDGKQELVLTPAGITILRNGSPRAEITVTEEQSAVVLRDRGGRKRAAVVSWDGPAAVFLLGQDEKDLAVLAAGDKATASRLDLFAGDASPRAGLSVGWDGRGAMTMVSSPSARAMTTSTRGSVP